MRHPIARRDFVSGLLTLAVAAPVKADPWRPAEPPAAGFREDPGALLDAAKAAGRLDALNGVVAIRSGRLAVERYYRGIDLRRGRLPQWVDFGPDTPHPVWSISKSIVSLLYGIARADGVVPDLSASLYAQFPDYSDLASDSRRRITIGHVMTMSSGLDWNERARYGSPDNSQTQSNRAADLIRFILERPVVAAPGTVWNYNSGGTALIGALITRAVGQDLEQFARERLFSPLGIENLEWERGSRGIPVAAGGLRMTPRDLATVGQMVLQQGMWDGRQLVPSDWLEASFASRIGTGYRYPSSAGYGYFWWIGRTRTGGYPQIAGFGHGGQRLVIVPELDLVMVATAGAYGHEKSGRFADAVLNDILIPSIDAGR